MRDPSLAPLGSAGQRRAMPCGAVLCCNCSFVYARYHSKYQTRYRYYCCTRFVRTALLNNKQCTFGSAQQNFSSAAEHSAVRCRAVPCLALPCGAVSCFLLNTPGTLPPGIMRSTTCQVPVCTNFEVCARFASFICLLSLLMFLFLSQIAPVLPIRT